ncbi:glycoside hydrolase family 79 protein [Piloderma croceum F 1598]|uniref:Glycoside hydrolase family 79 protein n=1 Tax=Piloderma croceum (strain F 1598) TaxID=765440 RepID=A0A0C3FQP1_PILCF|nr:glycoside hydrolase family 79 protein [Piloderma croceum F 1598]
MLLYLFYRPAATASCRLPRMWLLISFWSLLYLDTVWASVTVYSQLPLGQATATAAAANYTGAAAYDPTVLNPPPIPDPAPGTQPFIQLFNSNTSQGGLSIPISGSFYGFSIEMSVANQVLGVNSTFLQVPFLNIMAAFKQRGGSPRIRVGGNTQETAWMVDSIPGGKVLIKSKGNSSNPTQTPALMLSPELLYMMNNISNLVGVKWFLGIPMNDTQNVRLQIGELGESILGPNILGFQVGNEPDLYGRHGVGGRPASYSPEDYFNEFGVMMAAINNDTNMPTKNNIIGPSVSTSQWTMEDVFNTGYIPAYTHNLGAISVEKYPDDNCLAVFGGAGQPKVPQTEFALYLDHTAGVNIVKPFLNASAIALANNKPFYMFETNTASCGGFPGISDSYGAGLWALDYGLQMAYSNFSTALLHVGGQNVYYNPFTPPPTNQTSFHQWTIGPILYSALIVSEALGPTDTAQVVDLNPNNANILTPGYAIYEQGTLARVALFNYVTDPTGAHAYTASLAVGGGSSGQPNGSPQTVKVKYFNATSVSQKFNITWAGQTFGNTFESDGRLQGDLDVKTVSCNNNICQIYMPAPSFALVFFTDTAYTEATPDNPQTFSTTAQTRVKNTATVDAAVLSTSNGHSGSQGRNILGSTSLEHNKATSTYVPSTAALVALAFCAILIGHHNYLE